MVGHIFGTRACFITSSGNTKKRGILGCARNKGINGSGWFLTHPHIHGEKRNGLTWAKTASLTQLWEMSIDPQYRIDGLVFILGCEIMSARLDTTLEGEHVFHLLWKTQNVGNHCVREKWIHGNRWFLPPHIYAVKRNNPTWVKTAALTQLWELFIDLWYRMDGFGTIFGVGMVGHYFGSRTCFPPPQKKAQSTFGIKSSISMNN